LPANQALQNLFFNIYLALSFVMQRHRRRPGQYGAVFGGLSNFTNQ